MGIAKWENFLENHIEGFFNKKFASALEAAEVKRELQKEMLRRHKKGCRKVVPNEYRIYVSGEDYGRLCSRRFAASLYALVERQVIRDNAFMEGELRLVLEKKAELPLGSCQIVSSYAGEREESGKEPDTIVVKSSSLTPPLDLPPEVKLASLTVAEGQDADAYLEFGERQIYLGRKEQNDFILTDPNVSRLHATITYERHRHVLHDAQSKNGTFVNGKAVPQICLCDGDSICIGNTMLRYEVLR